MALSNRESMIIESYMRPSCEGTLGKLNSKVPIFTVELLISLGLTILPPGDYFKGTSLSGCEGKYISELSQPELEKITLWFVGFTRNFKYAGTHIAKIEQSHVPQETYQKIKSLVKSFFDINCNVGIRVHRGKVNGTTSKPFCWAPCKSDEYLIIADDGSLKLNLISGEQYTLEPGDELQIFSSPVSATKKMVVKEKSRLEDGKIEETKKLKEIDLGGGFVCRLGNYDSSKDIFSLEFNFITNNGNPRHIGDKSEDYKYEKYPEEKVILHVEAKDGRFVLVDGGNSLSLRDVVDSQDMEKVLRHTAKNIVINESSALYKLFITSLNIYPKLNFHAVKGFYAIEKEGDEGNLISSSMTFDTELAEQAELWVNGFGKASIRNPSLLLESIYKELGVKKRELAPSERLVLAKLALNGKLWQRDKDIISRDEISKSLESIKDILIASGLGFINYILSESFENEDKLRVIKTASKETNEIIQSLLSERQYKNNSAESLFGKLMWTVIGRSTNLKEIEGHEGIYEYSKGNSTAIISDKGDFKIGFLVQDGEIVDLEDILAEKESNDRKNMRLNKENSTSRFKIIRKIVSENFGLEIPAAMMRYVLD